MVFKKSGTVTPFIASRLEFKGKMAMVCIAVSFLVMIIAVAVSSGFRNEIRDGVATISGDVQITPVNMNYIGGTSPIERQADYLEHILDLPSVKSVVPVAYRAGIIKNNDNIHGVLFKGTPQTGSDTLSTLEVCIPRRLAAILSLEEGDEMLTYFIEEKVKARKFKVAALYDAPVEVDDKLVVYANLSDIQRLNEWDEGQVSALEINLYDKHRSVRGINNAAQEIGWLTFQFTGDDQATVVSTSAPNKYPQLFDWLNLIDFNLAFILVLMTIVAGFNMISGLLIMLFEHISTIGLLKSLGMTDRAIAKVFLRVSSTTVLKGMVAGNLIAFAICLIQHLTHLVTLNPANYFVSFIPVHLNVLAILAADAIAYLVIMLLLMIPSLFIARVDPAKTLTVE